MEVNFEVYTLRINEYGVNDTVSFIQISLPGEYFGKERPHRKDPLRREDTGMREKEITKHLLGIYNMQ